MQKRNFGKIQNKGEKMREVKFNNNGITLLALVITIIILLILAGVSISVLGGQNGIIKNATESKKQSEIGEIIDKVRIDIADEQIEKKNAGIASSELEKILNKYGNLTGEGTILDKILETEKGYKIPVKEIWSGTLVVEPLNLQVGDYIKYNVTYTDVYTLYSFTAENGWRVLAPGTDNGDGTVTGLKLISTGIPVKLNYNGNNINTKEYSETNPILGNWAGNTKQRKEYANKFNLSNNNYNNQYAAAGLYYNFKKIKFDQGINASQNEGCYNAVNGKTTGTLSETEFIAGGAEEVHALTLAEINEARGESDLTNTPLNENSGAKGLFYLTALEDYGYTKTNMSTSPNYFLASPVIGNTNSLNCVDDKGQLTSVFSVNYGVRTVISLPPDFEVEKVE